MQRCLSSPRGCVQRCLSNPLKPRGKAMLQIVFDVFGHGAQLQGIEHCSCKFICSYRCHAAVLCRFGLHARKRMPSPSSAFTSMADQKASTPLSTCVEVNDALRQAQRVVGVGWALIRDGVRCTASHVAPPEVAANDSQGLRARCAAEQVGPKHHQHDD